MIEELTDSQKALAEYMSGLSEEAYFAGWMEGLEYALWKAVVENPFEYGFLQLTEQHIAELTKLSNACGGWIVFDDDSAETFVPIAKWRKIYAKNCKPKTGNLMRQFISYLISSLIIAQLIGCAPMTETQKEREARIQSSPQSQNGCDIP